MREEVCQAPKITQLEELLNFVTELNISHELLVNQLNKLDTKLYNEPKDQTDLPKEASRDSYGLLDRFNYEFNKYSNLNSQMFNTIERLENKI